MIIVKKECQACQGTGERGSGDPALVVPCTDCEGSGYIGTRYRCSDFDDLVEDVDKCLKRLKKIMDHLGLND